MRNSYCCSGCAGRIRDREIRDSLLNATRNGPLQDTRVATNSEPRRGGSNANKKFASFYKRLRRARACAVASREPRSRMPRDTRVLRCWTLTSSVRALFSYDFNPICMHHVAVHAVHYVTSRNSMYLRYTMGYALYYPYGYVRRHAPTHRAPS